ncbi:MAG: hypothetical protein ACF8PN_08470 [Phycisphaerales bacterium]
MTTTPTTPTNPTATNETPLELEVERVDPPVGDDQGAAPAEANDDDSPVERAIAARLERVERELETTRRAIERADRSSTLDRRLIAAGVLDLDAARALVPDAKLDAASSDDAVAALVANLRRSRPSLFRRVVVKSATVRRTGAAAARSALAPAEDESAAAARTPERARLATATTRAAATGRVDDLMRYLRAKRSAAA